MICNLKHLARGLALGLALATAAVAAAASEAWPSKRLTIVVPFSAGGSTDTVARILAGRLAADLGQTVIVENKPGASGNIAGDYVARSAPDGYTLFMGTSTSIANISLYRSIPFDILKDFTPVSQVVHTPLVLVTHPQLPVNSIEELIRHAKDRPGVLNYGSGGNGTSQHLGGVMFEHLAKARMTHVPYKGAAPAMTDLIAGNIQLMFAPSIDALPFIRSGRVKALGVTTAQRSPKLPDTPSLASVLPGFDVATWNAIFVPAKTPPAVVQALSAAIVKAMNHPEARKAVDEQGSEVVASTAAEFKTFLDREVVIWKQLVEISGAKID